MAGEGYSRPGENGAGYFSGTDNRFRETGHVCLAAGVTLDATADGPGVELGDKGVLRLTLDVTAHTEGGDTLDVDIETSKDNGDVDPWRVVDSFAQSTAVGSETLSFSGLDRFARYVATLGGGGAEMTFTIDGEAV